MKIFKNNLCAWHLKSFLWIYFIFTAIIAFMAYSGIDQHHDHTKLFLQTTLGSISGPMIGAISREFQGCCLKCSLNVMKLALPILLFGTGLQFLNLPDRRWIGIPVRGVWICAWITWFLLGIATFGHALT